MATWTNHRTFGLAASVALIALAGCSAPQGPEAQGSDYYAEPPPPPLMGAAPQPRGDDTGLAGGPPTQVQGEALPAAGPRQDGVITFRRADGVLVTTMRPVANPEDMDPRQRAEVYGKPKASSAAQRSYAQAPSAPRVSSSNVAAAPPRAERAAPAPGPAPSVKAAPAPKTAQKAVPAPAPQPTAPIQSAPTPELTSPGEAAGKSGGGFMSFLERFKFWDREDSADAGQAAERAAEQAAQTAGEAADVAETAAADAADAAQEAGSGISGRTVLLALLVVAAVLILAAISRNAAARRREDARRRRFRTFGYGQSEEAENNDRGSSLAAPLAAAAAGAAVGAAAMHAHDEHQDDHHSEGHDPASEDTRHHGSEDAEVHHGEHEPA